MEPKIETEADSIGPLPAGYDDDRTDRDIFDSIERVLQDDLALRGEGKSKQVNRKRRDWELLSPSFVEADATTIESLTDVAAQGRLLKSLAGRAKELGGTHHTVNGRLQSLLWGLSAAGLGKEHVQRIQKNLGQVKRATGYTEDYAKGYTMEEWGAFAKTLDRICENPSDFVIRRQWVFNERSAKMTRAAAWVTAVGALRISETLSIKVNEIDSEGFTYYISKHRNYPEPRTKPFVVPDVWQHVESYLEVRNADDDRLFNSSDSGLANMVRAAMIEAGLQKHNGRLGLHGFRHTFTSHSIENDYGGVEGRQHTLGHKSPDTQSIYTRTAAKDAAVERAAGPWQEALVEEAGELFTWDRTMGEGYYTAMLTGEMPPVPQSALGPGEVLFDGKVCRLGAPVCFHDHYAMMPLLDDDGVTIEWGIVEMREFKPVRLIVARRSIGWARPDLNCNLKGHIAAFFEGYRAALGVPPSQ